MTIEDLRRLLRQLREESKSDPMLERLMEMCREWWRENCITPCSQRGRSVSVELQLLTVHFHSPFDNRFHTLTHLLES